MAKRILVPLDGSLRAEAAIPVAARLARAENGTVILDTLRRNPARAIRRIEISSASWRIWTCTRGGCRCDVFALCRGHEALADVRTTTAVYACGGVSTILAVARTQAADAIVLWDGRPSDGDGDGRTSGTLAQRLARRAPMPVLVVREEWPWTRPTLACRGGRCARSWRWTARRRPRPSSQRRRSWPPPSPVRAWRRCIWRRSRASARRWTTPEPTSARWRMTSAASCWSAWAAADLVGAARPRHRRRARRPCGSPPPRIRAGYLPGSPLSAGRRR